VMEIRRLAKTEPQNWIARTYHVTDGLVSQIVNGHAWGWLKTMSQAVSLLILLAVAAGAAAVHGYDDDGAKHPSLLEIMGSCDIAVSAFLSPNMQPRNECEYPLNNVVVFQKVKGGYLLVADIEKGGTETGVIFLKTKAPLPRGMRFDNEPVRSIGTYEYEAIDGFKTQVWAFDVVMPGGKS